MLSLTRVCRPPSAERPFRLTSLCTLDGTGDLPQPVAWLLSSADGPELGLDLINGVREVSLRTRGCDVPAPRYLVADKLSSFQRTWEEATGHRPQRLLDQQKARALLNTEFGKLTGVGIYRAMS